MTGVGLQNIVFLLKIINSAINIHLLVARRKKMKNDPADFDIIIIENRKPNISPGFGPWYLIGNALMIFGNVVIGCLM